MPLISCDGSALEWRGAVELSGDPVGLAEILNKDDIHTNNQIAFNLPDRLISKNIYSELFLIGVTDMPLPKM